MERIAEGGIMMHGSTASKVDAASPPRTPPARPFAAYPGTHDGVDSGALSPRERAGLRRPVTSRKRKRGAAPTGGRAYPRAGSAYFLRAVLRHISGQRIDIRLRPSQAQLLEYTGTQWVTRDNNTNFSIAQDTWYDVVAKLSGEDVSVLHGPKGGELEEILSTDSALLQTTASFWFQVPANAQFRVDDVKIIDGTMSSTWTKTYNAANELTQMQNSAQGTTINYTYDAWGRTTEKTMGGKSAEYAWRYGSKLREVTSTMPDEGNVTYQYGGDKKRRSREVGSDYTWYNWDMGWNTISEADNAGNLTTATFTIPRVGDAPRWHTWMAPTPALRPTPTTPTTSSARHAAFTTAARTCSTMSPTPPTAPP